MFTAFQKLSFGLMSSQPSNQVPCTDLPEIRKPAAAMPANESNPASKQNAAHYSCLSDIFGEMVDEQSNCLSKW
jgi:hypothetical protein